LEVPRHKKMLFPFTQLRQTFRSLDVYIRSKTSKRKVKKKKKDEIEWAISPELGTGKVPRGQE
jgi:hypothetical protein